jgi:hypothetical protein
MPKKNLAIAGPRAKRRGRHSNRYWAHGDVGQLTDVQVEFAMALDRFKREKNRPYPSCSEVLDVLLSLGYRKVEPGNLV